MTEVSIKKAEYRRASTAWPRIVARTPRQTQKYSGWLRLGIWVGGAGLSWAGLIAAARLLLH